MVHKNIGMISTGVSNSQINDSAVIERILRKLKTLPEVKLSHHYIDSFSNHNHGISMTVMKRPDNLTKYYWIAVGYNSSERFETYYNFYVWPDKMTIKYYETLTGKTLTLAEWRKNRKSGEVIQ
jgi:hypothetical protein